MSSPKGPTTSSGLPLDACYGPPSEHGFDPTRDLGSPGQYPYTRGVYETMYRGKLWTRRMFAGFGTPEQTNRRLHFLLEQGQTGLSIAFDMPTLMGYDPDHPRALGEVGREGVAVATLDDMLRLLAGIRLDQVTTSMTINAPAIVLLAFYIAAGERQGLGPETLAGTLQNDMLKEFVAQKEWISPIHPSMRIIRDMLVYCSRKMPKWNTISVSGYHIREAGSTAVQELAFTLADGIAYLELGREAGLDIDDFAPRLSFFFDIHNDFFEEIAKLRAARRLWARLVRERFAAKNPRSMMLRMHAQTAGVSLTAQQPMNNIVRVALQALAGVLGGTQSLHTNSYDETYALPTEDAVTIALRTQQILAHESGVPSVVDPLGGSYFVEQLTRDMEEAALVYIRKIDEMGGMVRAIEEGYPQREIASSAYAFQKAVDSGERVIVGVNQYGSPDRKRSLETLKIDQEPEQKQVQAITAWRAARNAKQAEATLQAVRAACSGSENLVPPILAAVQAGVTLGEICGVFREVFGEHRDPAYL